MIHENSKEDRQVENPIDNVVMSLHLDSVESLSAIGFSSSEAEVDWNSGGGTEQYVGVRYWMTVFHGKSTGATTREYDMWNTNREQGGVPGTTAVAVV